MSTAEEDELREHAIEQIVQQIKKEFEDKRRPLPSQLALRIIAKRRLDNPNFGLAKPATE